MCWMLAESTRRILNCQAMISSTMSASGVEVGGKYVDTEKAREIAVLDPGFTCKRPLFDAGGDGEQFSSIFHVRGECSGNWAHSPAERRSGG